MPQCYLLSVSVGSSIDQATNNVSLFNLVEQVTAAQLGVSVPLEVHVFWQLEQSEYDQDIQMRVGFIPEEPTDGNSVDWLEPATFRSSTPRMRTRGMGLRLPGQPGFYRLIVEWFDETQEEWIRSSAFWPFLLESSPNDDTVVES